MDCGCIWIKSNKVLYLDRRHDETKNSITESGEEINQIGNPGCTCREEAGG
jgi:hypothetical protein